MEENKNIAIVNEDFLFDKVSELIEESRKRIVKAVNTAMVYTYYGVGRYIVEFEQGGSIIIKVSNEIRIYSKRFVQAWQIRKANSGIWMNYRL